MEFRTKRIPIKNGFDGLITMEQFRECYGDDKVDGVKIINEISFNVPIYEFGTDNVIGYYNRTSEWYLRFPEEIIIEK